MLAIDDAMQLYNTMNFHKYLLQLASKQAHQSTRFVIGNSSVDYDSFFGSIILAFFLTSTTKSFHIPIIDCHFQELKLRFQIEKVLEKLQINPKIFRYKPILNEQKQTGIFNLYDHNVRQGINKIDLIVDHHEYNQVIARKHLIEHMGSGLTLLYFLLKPSKLGLIQLETQQQAKVVKDFREFVSHEPLNIEKQSENGDLEVQQIIRYGILLDTFGFDHNQKQRWTKFDKKAVQFIEQNKEYEMGFKQLEQLKFDEERNRNLSLTHSLIKDYKKYQYNGLIAQYSIIYLSPQKFYDNYKEQIQKSNQMGDQLSDVYFLMSIFKGIQSKKLERQILVRLKNDNQSFRQTLFTFFKSLKLDNKGKIGEWYWFKDPTATISRKVFDKKFSQFYSKLISSEM